MRSQEEQKWLEGKLNMIKSNKEWQQLGENSGWRYNRFGEARSVTKGFGCNTMENGMRTGTKPAGMVTTEVNTD